MRERWGILGGMPRSCLFFRAEGPLTREHAFPVWLQRALGVRGARISVQMSTKDPEEHDSLNMMEMTLREVCAECNHHWLHDLERAFRAVMRPTIQGVADVQMTLSRDSQLVIAMWAVKTWFLVQRGLARLRGGVIAGDNMEYMRTYNEPPELTQVWIGRIERRDDHLLVLGTNDVVTEAGEALGWISNLVVGGLVIAVFVTARFVDGSWQGIDLDPSAFEQVWPHESEEVLWPPATILTLESLLELFPKHDPIVVAA
jgi:hypothetical protein